MAEYDGFLVGKNFCRPLLAAVYLDPNIFALCFGMVVLHVVSMGLVMGLVFSLFLVFCVFLRLSGYRLTVLRF